MTRAGHWSVPFDQAFRNSICSAPNRSLKAVQRMFTAVFWDFKQTVILGDASGITGISPRAMAFKKTERFVI